MKFSIFALALATAALAAPLSSEKAIISHKELTANRAKGLRLIQTEETEGSLPVWKTEDEVLELIDGQKGFFDVTETYEDNLKIEAALKFKAEQGSAQRATWPPISQQTNVNGVIGQLSTAQMTSYLSTLTAYNNRYYTSTTGVSSSNWIYTTLGSITSARSDITVSQFTHTWAQKSVIVKFAGTSTTSPITILGCHLDSTAGSASARSPGADDNGSGCVNLMDTVRSIVSYGYVPRTPLEFHWYSGEEAGLLGSQAISNNYVGAGKSIKAYVNLDMTGYFKPGTTEVVALVSDRTDATLNTYLKSLISTYLRIGAGSYTCGYGCSDHASWTTKGIPAAFPFEAPSSNPNIHTSGDTTSVSGWSWAHSLEFAKLAVAVAVELTA